MIGNSSIGKTEVRILGNHRFHRIHRR